MLNVGYGRTEGHRARKALIVLVVLPVLAFAAVALGSLTRERPPAGSAFVAEAPATAPAWIDITKPAEMFSVSAPEFDGAPRSTVARRHRTGGGRQDFLSFGIPDGANAYLRLVIYRVGTEDAPETPLFVEAARRAADVGLGIRHAGTPYVLATRFGRFDALDLAMASEAVPACTGVRLRVPSPDLRIAGLVCGPRARALSPTALACLLERIDVTAAAADPALTQFFASTELARNPACAGGTMGPTPAHAAWLEDAGSPSRRLAKAGRNANQKAPKPL